MRRCSAREERWRKLIERKPAPGRTVWNRLDFTEAKHAGGGARRRAKEEWVIAEDTHLAIVEDELFEAAQGRFSTRARGNGSAHAKRAYVLSGRVRCASDHGPR